jgi:hypothetical protein
MVVRPEPVRIIGRPMATSTEYQDRTDTVRQRLTQLKEGL